MPADWLRISNPKEKDEELESTEGIDPQAKEGRVKKNLAPPLAPCPTILATNANLVRVLWVKHVVDTEDATCIWRRV